MFDEIFAGITVTIDTERCLNTRHDRAGCRRCVDACPTAAIVLSGHQPALTSDACVRCGACVPVCPTDAVVGNDLPERRLVDACDALGGTELVVTCAVNPQPAPGQIVRHGRCLAALTAEQLLTLTGDGTRAVTIDLGWCSRCPIGTAGDTAIDTVDTVNALLALLGRPHSVAVLGTPDRPPEAAPQADVIDSRHAPVTRRGIFTTLRRRAQTAAERAVATPPPPMRRSSGPVPRRLPQTLPASRRRLLDRLGAISTRPTSDGEPPTSVPSAMLPFAVVHVDESACSGCGLCARYCPTQALAFTTQPPDEPHPHSTTDFSLSFRTDHCIDCGICAVACPEHAIDFGDAIERDALTAPQHRLVAAGPLVACSACGLPTSPTGPTNDARCFSCRLGSGVVTALRDDAGLMADLLGRIPPEH